MGRCLIASLAVISLGFVCIRGQSLPTIDYLNLNLESKFLVEAFAKDGILLVPGVPGYAAARTAALLALAPCLNSAQGSDQVLRRLLADGSERSTIATKTHGHALQPLSVGCPDFQQKADMLRTVVHIALAEVLRVWGQAGISTEERVILRHDAGHAYTSLAEAASDATHLEHFHLYSSKDADESNASLGLHTDAGLLLAFTSPLYQSDHASGLWIQRTSSIEPVELPADAIAFVVGELASLGQPCFAPRTAALAAHVRSSVVWYHDASTGRRSEDLQL